MNNKKVFIKNRFLIGVLLNYTYLYLVATQKISDNTVFIFNQFMSGFYMLYCVIPQNRWSKKSNMNVERMITKVYFATFVFSAMICYIMTPVGKWTYVFTIIQGICMIKNLTIHDTNANIISKVLLNTTVLAFLSFDKTFIKYKFVSAHIFNIANSLLDINIKMLKEVEKHNTSRENLLLILKEHSINIEKRGDIYFVEI